MSVATNAVIDQPGWISIINLCLGDIHHSNKLLANVETMRKMAGRVCSWQGGRGRGRGGRKLRLCKEIDHQGLPHPNKSSRQGGLVVEASGLSSP